MMPTAAHAQKRYVMLSLRSRAVAVEGTSRSSCRQLVDLIPATSVNGRVFQALIRARMTVLGDRLLSRHEWPLPVPPESWDELRTYAEEVLGEPQDFHWHLPPSDQPQVKFGVLCADSSGPRAFMRVRLDGHVPRLTPQHAAGQSTGIAFPVRMAIHRSGALAAELTTAVLERPHRPTEMTAEQLLSLVSDIESALDLPRPEGVPEHWRPAHGDLTPWNLRRQRHGRITLVDWEEANWAPPHADVARYVVTSRRTSRLLRDLPQSLLAGMAEASAFTGIALGRPADTTPSWATRAVSRHQHALQQLRTAVLGATDA